ncbi:hypothetical protein B5F55_12040 [Anaerotruncus colihominis]|nr:hypothetical protein B5F55_12040 [Anaerotruncus colihominis]
MQDARQPRGVCHFSCWRKVPLLNRCLAACGPRWRARPVRGSLTAGRSGARDLCAGRSPPGASLARPAIRGFPALRRRARTSRGSAPQRASRDRGGPPLSHGPNPGAGAAYINAAQNPLFAAQPVSTQRLPHCLRRSRLKFFAELFFKKAGGAAD